MQIEAAIALAATAHMGQLDKAGEPYILHPLRVMLRVPAPLRVAAVLHDVLEDCPGWTEARLFGEGVTRQELDILDALTRRAEESYAQFIRRCGKDRMAAIVKLADLADNMDPERVRMIPDNPDRMARYLEAHDYLSAVIAYGR